MKQYSKLLFLLSAAVWVFIGLYLAPNLTSICGNYIAAVVSFACGFNALSSLLKCNNL